MQKPIQKIQQHYKIQIWTFLISILLITKSKTYKKKNRHRKVNRLIRYKIKTQKNKREKNQYQGHTD